MTTKAHSPPLPRSTEPVASRTSADEVRAQAIEEMGDDLGQLFFLLRGEVAWIHLTWSEYRSLFASGQELFDLFNATAPSFFAHLDDLMWREVLLHLCRLTDRRETGRKKNLTLLALPPLIQDPDLRRQVDRRVQEARNATQFARDWRNRHIAHRSLQRAKNPNASPLEPASRKAVETALDVIRAVMHLLDAHYFDQDTRYEMTQPAPGNSEALLYYLRRGADAAEEDQKAGR